MEPRKEQKQEPRAPKAHKVGQKPKLQIVKLEGRITPGFIAPLPYMEQDNLFRHCNHNETLVREPAKASQVRKDSPRRKLQIVKLEERITPTPSIPIPPPGR